MSSALFFNLSPDKIFSISTSNAQNHGLCCRVSFARLKFGEDFPLSHQQPISVLVLSLGKKTLFGC